MNLYEVQEMSTRLMLAQDLQDDVLAVMATRKGFDAWWDSLDEDIQDEILAALYSKFVQTLKKR